MLRKAFKYSLICCGLALPVGALAAVVIDLDRFARTPRQLLLKLVEDSGVDAPALVSLLEPPAKHTDRLLDGQIKAQHPRILLPGIAALSPPDRVAFFRRRNNLYQSSPTDAPALPCAQTHLSALTTCWFATGDARKFDLALEKLLAFKVETPAARASYGNGWQLALNYDLLASSPKMTAEQHRQIQSKLETTVVEYLRVLDDESASLWHGRLSLSSNAWLGAIMLDANTDRRRELITRAQSYFLDTVQSVAITEAWPEGFNYWINSRGFYFVLAASAYINGLQDSQHADKIKRLLERVGLWHIYATRPDNRIQGYADEGPRVDLKDETRRVIDIIASTTGNPSLANFSLYLQKLHGRASYYRAYRWGFHLFNDPELLPATATGALAEFGGRLPESALFGRNGSNALYVRSDWGRQATYLSYRAGHSFTHHGHYDAGHFTLFKGQPLAVNSSQYGEGMTSTNRLNYSLRTIAKNSLLIQRPAESVKPNRFFAGNVAAGGQRMTLPTGSAITSTRHWQDNLYKNQHLQGAELEQFSASADYTYIRSDLTPAYNNTRYDETGDDGKVAQVQRALFYLNNEDILLVHDRIETTNPAYRAKWLLHSLGKPRVSNEEVLKGSADDGILRSISQRALIQEKNSSLKINALLPQDATLHLVGGASYRFYVETDGDDEVLDGTNMSEGANDKPWFDRANWRLEIFSAARATEKRFLIALAPAANGLHRIETTLLVTSDKNQYGALLDTAAVIFTQSRGQFTVQLPASVQRLYLVGASHEPREVLSNGSAALAFQYKDGVTQVLLPDNGADKSLQIE